MKNLDGYIAVIDSGVGGISVLKECTKLLPNEKFYYFGDSLFAPYGEKSIKEIQDRTLEIVNTLVNRKVKAIVVACNTATSAAISIIRNVYALPIIGVEPALKPAIESGYENVGVMATYNTLRLDKYKELAKQYKEVHIEEISAIDLAKAIEKGDLHSQEIKDLLQKYLHSYIGKIDALVLGCTHYPFVLDEIKQVLGDIAYFDGSKGTSQELKRQLEKHQLLNDGEGDVIFDSSLKKSTEIELYKKLYE